VAQSLYGLGCLDSQKSLVKHNDIYIYNYVIDIAPSECHCVKASGLQELCNVKTSFVLIEDRQLRFFCLYWQLSTLEIS